MLAFVVNVIIIWIVLKSSIFIIIMLTDIFPYYSNTGSMLPCRAILLASLKIEMIQTLHIGSWINIPCTKITEIRFY